jgi:hypothetical protein
VELVIEEVEGRNIGRSTALYMAQPEERRPEKQGRARMYLTRGEQRSYRIRMTYKGETPAVFHEALDISPEKETFEKGNDDAVRVIDLAAMRMEETASMPTLQVFPNPSSGDVTILVTRCDVSHERAMRLEIVDYLGRTVYLTRVIGQERINIAGLPTGTFVARLSSEDSAEPHAPSPVMISIIR